MITDRSFNLYLSTRFDWGSGENYPGLNAKPISVLGKSRAMHMSLFTAGSLNPSLDQDLASLNSSLGKSKIGPENAKTSQKIIKIWLGKRQNCSKRCQKFL